MQGGKKNECYIEENKATFEAKLLGFAEPSFTLSQK